jgi:nucleoside-diphosphate-sugar epimerase
LWCYYQNCQLSIRMKVLVTGATGFIGTYVIEELLQHNIQVIASSSNAAKAKHFAWYDKVIYKPFHVSTENNMNCFTYFEEPTHAIHLAWEGLPNYLDLFHLERNLYQNYFFIKNLVENGLQNLTVIGTCFEYGMLNGCLSESLQTNPQNSYGLAKDSLRKFIEILQTKKPFSFKWVRLFYMYGKGQSEKSLLAQLDKALEKEEQIFNMSGGEQLRDYLPVEKVAENLVLIALQDKIQGIINCCSGKPISIRNLVERYLQEKNKSIHLNLGYYPYPTYEPLAFWGDNTKLYDIRTNQG